MKYTNLLIAKFDYRQLICEQVLSDKDLSRKVGPKNPLKLLLLLSVL